MGKKILSKPGLEGVYIVESKISEIDGEQGKLFYRGIPVEVLAEKSSYEETAFLLLYGYLPNYEELEKIKYQFYKYKIINNKIFDFLEYFDKTASMMDILRTAISFMGTLDEDNDIVDIDKVIKVTAAMETLIAAAYRIKNNLEPIVPDRDLSHAQNFYYMMTGNKPDYKVSKILESALILHAEQGLNASTFTSMVISSSLSDIYSAVSGAIGTLKGVLHGGANMKVIEMFDNIKTPDNVEIYLKNLLEKKEKIMGFGHRVYKTWDPRAKFFKNLIKKNFFDINNIYIRIAEKVEHFVAEKLRTKKIYPNIDFYSGILYSIIGIPSELFTPIFAMSRVIGWGAHILEYRKNNRIFRPLSIYSGELDKRYIPIEER